MLLPKTVQVGPKLYTIELQERLIAQAEAKALLGECSTATTTLRFDPSYPKRLTDTLLHEVLHAIDFEYKLDLDHDVLDRLTNALLDTLQRNQLSFVEDFTIDE